MTPDAIEVLLATPEDGLYDRPRPFDAYLENYLSDRRFHWTGLLDGGSVEEPVSTVELPLIDIEGVRWKRPAGLAALIFGIVLLALSPLSFLVLDWPDAVAVVWPVAGVFFICFYVRYAATRIPTYIVTARGREYVLMFGGKQRTVARYAQVLRQAVAGAKKGLRGRELHDYVFKRP